MEGAPLYENVGVVMLAGGVGGIVSSTDVSRAMQLANLRSFTPTRHPAEPTSPRSGHDLGE